jgi:ABC-2 type transport system permease protein
MMVVLTLVRKNLLDSRWLLLLCGSALFGLCWLFAFAAHRAEVAMQLAMDSRRMGMLRGMGGASMNSSSAAIVMAYWNFPFITLIWAIWAIARGSNSVAGEIEKGTIDLVLSRPVARTSFLLAQVITAVLGLALMGGAMMAGNLWSGQYNTMITPPSAYLIGKPTLNLIAFGWAIFGYSFLVSTLDIIRWRPTMIASVATLAGFIALIVSTLPQLDLKWLEKLSIFKAYDPVEAVVKGENLAFNISVLGIIGLVGVVLGFVIFARRDLPAGS